MIPGRHAWSQTHFCWRTQEMSLWILHRIRVEELTHWKRPWYREAMKAKGERSGRGWNGLDSITNTTDMNLSKLQETVKDREAWQVAVHEVAKSQTGLSKWMTAPPLLLPSYNPSCRTGAIVAATARTMQNANLNLLLSWLKLFRRFPLNLKQPKLLTKAHKGPAESAPCLPSESWDILLTPVLWSH